MMPMPAKNLEGCRFGNLTPVMITANENPNKSNTKIWLCICDCSNWYLTSSGYLLNGQVKHCGCMPHGNTGRKRPDLTLINIANTKHGQSKSSTYRSWLSMRQRCLNPLHKDYPNWGARGIKICERWNDFDNFLKDMGIRPKGKTIGRINNEADYSPGNCRWETSEEQSNNTRVNRYLTFKGKTMTIAQWAKELGMSRQALRYRIEAGWDDEDIFNPYKDHGLRRK